MAVWVTRAEPGAGATAARLQARGLTPLVAPVLRVVPLDPPDAPGDYAALAFTSANGVRAFSGWSARRDLPVYAVGEATAAAAREAGFPETVSADGDVAELARLILARAPPGLVLHACGAERAGDLEGALAVAGRPAATLPLYRTEALDRLPAAAGQALEAGALEAVLVHSPKAGRALAALLAEAAGRGRLHAVGLSSACLRPLEPLGLAALLPAARPDDAALLERLG